VPLKSRIPEIIEATEAGVALAVKRTAARIETGAKKRSRVDTGTMRAGWQQADVGDLEIMVFNPVFYTIFNEYGTIYMSAQPMLRPAIEEARGDFEREIRELYV
jgi:HK97 gp10 family phage protein